MNQICPICRTLYGPEQFQCSNDFGDLQPYVPPPDPEPPSTDARSPDTPAPDPPALEMASPEMASTDAEAWSPTVCWNCGTPATPGNGECLKPGCNKALTPPALVIVFTYGLVEIQPGEQAELGRVGQYERLFRSFPNVSRRHAEVGVDIDGVAWVVHRSETNPTYVNGVVIPGYEKQRLRHRDRLRLARHAEGTVRIFRR